MDLQKILKNIELEYGEDICLVIYPDGSGHIETEDSGEDFYFYNLSELELKFG